MKCADQIACHLLSHDILTNIAQSKLIICCHWNSVVHVFQLSNSSSLNIDLSSFYSVYPIQPVLTTLCHICLCTSARTLVGILSQPVSCGPRFYLTSQAWAFLNAQWLTKSRLSFFKCQQFNRVKLKFFAASKFTSTQAQVFQNMKLGFKQ